MPFETDAAQYRTFVHRTHKTHVFQRDRPNHQALNQALAPQNAPVCWVNNKDLQCQINTEEIVKDCKSFTRMRPGPAFGFWLLAFGFWLLAFGFETASAAIDLYQALGDTGTPTRQTKKKAAKLAARS